MDLTEYITDEKKEEKGVWEDFGKGCRLLIARAGNRRWDEEWKRISKPYKKQIKRDTLADEKATELIVKCMAKTILLDWENLKLNKEPLEYSYENAVKALSIKDFREVVSDIAQSMDQFKADEIREDTENL